MPITGLTNTGANRTVNELNDKLNSLEKSVAQLASGSAITQASDDASSLAAALQLKSDEGVLTQATKNAEQGSALIRVVEGALTNQLEILTQMKALTTKANTDALDDKGRALIDEEYQRLLQQVGDIATRARWMGVNLLTGGAGSTTLSAAVTQAATGLVAPGNSFAATLNADTTGLVSGTFTDATVTSVGSLYEVTVTMKNHTNAGEVTQTFKATVDAPVAAGTLALSSTADSQSAVVLNYHATDVTDISSAATFQTELRELLNLDVVGEQGARIDSLATAVNNGLTGVSNTVNTKPGHYALSYAANSNSLRLTDGVTVWSETVAAGAQTVTFNNGVVATLDGSFALNTAVTQVVFDVDAGSAVSLGIQVNALSTDTNTVVLTGATQTALGLNGTDVLTKANAATAGTNLDSSMQTVRELLARIGAQQAQLESTAENNRTTVENVKAARSAFFDADIAATMAEFTKGKVLSQIANATLSQILSVQLELAQLARQ